MTRYLSHLVSVCILAPVVLFNEPSFGAKLDPDEVLDLESMRPTGEWHEATVPDTLDLVEQMKMSINILTNSLNPEYSYAVQSINYNDTPERKYDNWDITPKNARQLPMLRQACGTDYNLEVEYNLMRTLLEAIRDDGLMYYPVTASKLKGTSYPQSNATTIFAMLNFYHRDGNEKWLDWIDHLAKGLQRLAIHVEDRAFYPMQAGIDPEGEWHVQEGQDADYNPTEEPHMDALGYEGAARAEANRLMSVLAIHYKMTGDRESLELAEKLRRYAMKPGMWAENSDEKRYPGYEHGIWMGHFHNGTQGLNSILDMALVTNSDWLKEFCREYYEHTRRNGIVRIGFHPAWSAPERYGRPADLIDYPEPCATGDFVVDAVRMSDAGLGDYWDDADYTARNHLLEQQICDLDKMRKVAGVEPDSAADELLKQFLGGFSHATPTRVGLYGVGGCCAVNGAQGLYYAWHGITRFDKGVATVNLFLNRASEWMDVDSYLPYEGKVVLHNKQARTALVRIPGWVEIEKVTCQIERRSLFGRKKKKTVSPPRYGNRLVLEHLKPKDKITLEFPVPEWTDQYTISGKKFTLTFKGSTVTDVSPRETGNYYQVYERDHFKANKAPTHKIKRFVPDKIIPLGSY